MKITVYSQLTSCDIRAFDGTFHLMCAQVPCCACLQGLGAVLVGHLATAAHLSRDQGRLRASNRGTVTQVEAGVCCLKKTR
jgi:hypothetical protein